MLFWLLGFILLPVLAVWLLHSHIECRQKTHTASETESERGRVRVRESERATQERDGESVHRVGRTRAGAGADHAAVAKQLLADCAIHG
jgi:hypothetical protein